MTPRFAETVDAVFSYALGLMDRIDRGENPSPEEERIHIRGWLDQGDAKLGQSETWKLAKYALVTWIDEVLIEAPWEGASWWREEALEVAIFETRSRFDQFFVKASEAAALSNKDALEVFYVCVVLGFRGLYREPNTAAVLVEPLGLPADLETWARRTATAIRLGQDLPPLSTSEQPGRGAPPLDGRFQLAGAILVGVVMLAINLVTGWSLWDRVVELF